MNETAVIRDQSLRESFVLYWKEGAKPGQRDDQLAAVRVAAKKNVPVEISYDFLRIRIVAEDKDWPVCASDWFHKAFRPGVVGPVVAKTNDIERLSTHLGGHRPVE